MAIVKRGAACKWGLGSFSVTGTVIGGADTTQHTQSVKQSKTSDKATVESKIGETVAAAYFNEYESATIEVILSADTLANIASESALPSPGTIMEIADSEDPGVAGTTLATNAWTVLKSDKNRTNKTAEQLTIDIERWVANNVSKAVT